MNDTQIKILRVVGGLRCVAPAHLRNIFSLVPHTSFHRAMRGLVKKNFLARIFHHSDRYCNYQLTDEGYGILFGSSDIRIPASRPSDIVHTALVAGALIDLSRYKFVECITPEHEITREKLKGFCVGRRPDAIVLLKNNFGIYEVAIEVERSLKSSKRLDEILDCYENSFQRNLSCKGLIIVAATSDILKAYKSLIEERPPVFDEKVLIIEPKDIDKLNPDVYGEISTRVDLTRHFGGTKVHDEIIRRLESSRSYVSKIGSLAPHK